MALARAMKFQPLFRSEYFDEIVQSIQIADETDRQNAFDSAVAGIKWLTPAEKTWLWNYLKNCGNFWSDPNVLDGFAPASTGW
jgi:hypothetical protein